MKEKIIKVFYGEDCYPYKDKERTVPYPLMGNSFVGSSNCTKIYFYFDQLGDETDSWIAVSKLPNGKIGSEILDIDYDEELQEHYAVLSLSSYYCQYKGDVSIALQGYEGGVTMTYNQETGLYEVSGTPTIQGCAPINFAVYYSPYFQSANQSQNVTMQQLLALIGTKMDDNSSHIIRVVPTTAELDISEFDEGQIFYSQSTKQFYQKVENTLVDYVIFNPGDTFVSVEGTDYVIPPGDR